MFDSMSIHPFSIWVKLQRFSQLFSAIVMAPSSTVAAAAAAEAVDELFPPNGRERE